MQFLDELVAMEKSKLPVDLDRVYNKQTQTKLWLKERRKAVSMLIKEKSGDPNMTTKKWNDHLNCKSVTWK
jgi:hypothetical protein